MKTLSSILIIVLGLLFFVPKADVEQPVLYYDDTKVYYSEAMINTKKDTIKKITSMLSHELDRIDFLINVK